MSERDRCPYLPKVAALRDGELDARAARDLRAHLAACADCRREEEALDRLTALLSQGDAASELPPERRRARREALLAACARDLAEVKPAPARVLPLVWWRRWWTPTRLALAMAPVALALLLLALHHLATRSPAAPRLVQTPAPAGGQSLAPGPDRPPALKQRGLGQAGTPPAAPGTAPRRPWRSPRRLARDLPLKPRGRETTQAPTGRRPESARRIVRRLPVPPPHDPAPRRAAEPEERLVIVAEGPIRTARQEPETTTIIAHGDPAAPGGFAAVFGARGKTDQERP